MNFKEALIAHLQGEKVEVKGESGWGTFPGEYGGSLLCEVLAGLYENYQIRLAPRTIIVNGVEVPAPEKDALKHGQKYCIPAFGTELMHAEYEWCGDSADFEYLKNGLVYLTAEDAIARAKAMLITKEV